ncbi:tetratricopeptide repeat protein [Candidatus Leptofilum sp.]|uniref:tetratricopeptide repeat protein n=1 Tax=Candidatus Leptofilum sp. TaxID=3241576 RepID=UPI003B5B17EA
MPFETWLNSLSQPTREILLGAAGDYLGGIASEITFRLLGNANYHIRKRFKTEPMQAALNCAMSQALYKSINLLTEEDELIIHYIDILGEWMKQEVVSGELAQLIDPRSSYQLDLTRLERTFRLLDYAPEYLDIDFFDFVYHFAHYFQLACDEQKELREIVNIRLVRVITSQLEEITRLDSRTAVASERTALATESIASALVPSNQQTKFTLPNLKHNLPQRVYNYFVGRKGEIDQLFTLLSPNHQAWVIVIDGIGGIGKTAIALEAAYYYFEHVNEISPSERFEAIIWVSAQNTVLTGEGIVSRVQVIRSLDDIYTTISVVLGHEEIFNRASSEERHELVRRFLTDQRTLLIIDNLESIDNSNILNFLQELPKPTKCIVTTRHRINVALPLRLAPMDEQDAKSLILRECEERKIRLEDQEVDQIYQRTEGVPLAMVWSISQIAHNDDVAAVLRQVRQPSGDVLHYILKDTFTLVENKPANTLLLAIALFPQHATREALKNVTGMSISIRDNGLEELEKLSLINNSKGRFSMLSITRSFVTHLLNEETIVDIQKRILEYYQDMIAKGNPELLTLERQNIVGIITVEPAGDSISLSKLIIEVIKQFIGYLLNFGFWDDVLKCSAAGGRLANELGDSIQHIDFILDHEEFIHYLRNDFDKAEKVTKEALNLSLSIGYSNGKAKALRNLGVLSRRRGDVPQAKTYLLEAQDSVDGVGELYRQISGTLASVYRRLGEFETAKEILEKEIEVCRHNKEDERDRLSIALGRYGTCLLESGQPQDAIQYFEESKLVDIELGRNSSIGFNFFKLAKCYNLLGKQNIAKKNAQQALDVFVAIGDQHNMQKTHSFLKYIEGEVSDLVE